MWTLSTTTKTIYRKKRRSIRFQREHEQLRPYYHLAGKDINLSCLHLDEKKNLWMGTTSNGVYCLSDDKQLSQPITKGNIASIYEDSSKELWIGSWEEGLYRIRTNGTIDNFATTRRIRTVYVPILSEAAAKIIWEIYGSELSTA